MTRKRSCFLIFVMLTGELMGDIGLDSFIVGFRLGAKNDLRYIFAATMHRFEKLPERMKGLPKRKF